MDQFTPSLEMVMQRYIFSHEHIELLRRHLDKQALILVCESLQPSPVLSKVIKAARGIEIYQSLLDSAARWHPPTSVEIPPVRDIALWGRRRMSELMEAPPPPQVVSEGNSEVAEGRSPRGNEVQCAICMSQVANAVIRPCRHKVCSRCLEAIVARNPRCPFCRARIEGR